MKLRIRTHGLFAVALATGFAACSGEDEQCFDDRSCPRGHRCNFTKPGEPGTCGPCDPTEIPYDGEDNDCNTRTRDRDLDLDGDNWTGAEVGPGGDCDDNDENVNSTIQESIATDESYCTDNKDNDCDGEVDEAECRDVGPPTVRFLQPQEGEMLAGTTLVRVQAEDDLEPPSVELFANNVELETKRRPDNGSVYEFTVDSSVFGGDGPGLLRADAIDVSAKRNSETITVNIDNNSPPTVTPTRPETGRAYSGRMTISATADDASGVASMEILLDGRSLATFTGTAAENVSHPVDTSTLAEGEHQVRFVAVDGRGNRGTTEVPFELDHTAPSVSFLAPAPGAIIQGDVAVSVSVTDNRNVSSVGFRNERRSTSGPIVTEDFVFSSTHYPNMQFVLTASASDDVVINDVAGGNFGVGTVVVILDNPILATFSHQDGDIVIGPTVFKADTPGGATGTRVPDITIKLDGVRINHRDTEGGAGIDWNMAFYDFSDDLGPHTVWISVVDPPTIPQPISWSVQIEAVAPPRFGFHDVKPLLFNEYPRSWDVGDLTGDGILDVIVCQKTTEYPMAIYEGSLTADGWKMGERRHLPRDYALTWCGNIRAVNVDATPELEILSWWTVNFRPSLAVYRVRPNGLDGQGFPLTDFDDKIYEVGDVNDDGLADLITSPGATVHLNQGGGQFTLGQQYGTELGGIRLVDVDLDSDIDIVTFGSYLTGYINNNADFSLVLSSPAPYEAQPNLQHLTIGDVVDVTGDGYPDVVVADLYGKVHTSAGLGNGSFNHIATSTVNLNIRSHAIAVGRLDADNLPDIVVANAVGVHSMKNMGGGRFERYALSHVKIDDYVWIDGTAKPMVLRDFDNDGDLDLLGYSGKNRALPKYGGFFGFSYLENIGGGVFSTVQAQPAEFDDISFGDITPDPGTEMVLNDDSGFRINKYVNGVMTTLSQHLHPGVQSRSVVGDFDGVGLDDIVFHGSFSLGMQFMINTGDGSSFDNYQLSGPRGRLAQGDFDGDGRSEVITADTGIGSTGIHVIGYDPATTTPSVLYDEPGDFYDVAVGNLENDANATLDLALLAYGGSSQTDLLIRTWNGVGFDSSSFPGSSGGAMDSVVITHADTDQVADIIVSGPVGTYLRQGFQGFGFGQPTPLFEPINPLLDHLEVADLNADGRDDIVFYDGNNESIVTMIGLQQGGFAPPFVVLPMGCSKDIAVVDVNNDGRPDVVCVNSTHISFILNETP